MKTKRVINLFILILLFWGNQSSAQTGVKKAKVPSSTSASSLRTTSPQTGISGDFGYLDEGTTITITAYYGKGEASIPPSINDKPVTRIDRNVFYSNSDVTRVSIPASVTDIGSQNFSRCVNLTSIDVDFRNPSFSSNNGVLFNQNKTVLINCPAGLAGTYEIPEGVTHIADDAFYYCENVSRVNVPSSLLVIGARAFYRCNNLLEITYPPKLTDIGDFAFYSCSSLETVTIPAGVKTIGSRAFYGCSSLMHAVFSGNAPRLSSDVFAHVANAFSISFQEGAAGFTSPSWAGYPCEPAKRNTSTEAPLYMAEGSLNQNPSKQGTTTTSESVLAKKKELITKLRSESTSSIESRMIAASKAELGKTIDVEDLLLDRNPYVGKVVKLKYKGIRFYASSSSSHLHVYGDEYSSHLLLSLPDDRDARKWAIDQSKDNYYYDDSNSGSLYVYVEDNSLLAVGRRNKKSGNSFTYSW